MEEIMSDDSPKSISDRRSRNDRRSASPRPFDGNERRKGPRRAEADQSPPQ
jgi:hypothetical protein